MKNPLEVNHYAGSNEEMALVAGFLKSKGDLDQRLRKAQGGKGALSGDEPVKLTKAEKAKLKKERQEAEKKKKEVAGWSQWGVIMRTA